MGTRTMIFRMVTTSLFVAASVIQAQTPRPVFTSIPATSLERLGAGVPVLRAHTEPDKPFTVAGERGVLVGQQDGSFEAWLLPVKLLSHLTIEADIEGYHVPIDVNRQAAEIEVHPDHTVITYAHIGFTVRQIMFSPQDAAPGTGPVVLFEFDCLHPTDFTFRFTPELHWMWPERSEGVPGVDWVTGTASHGGYYVLQGDYPELAGAITIPGAQPGILAPYEERPQVHPVELKLHIDPARDKGRMFPLLMAVGTSPAAATQFALGNALAQLNAGIADAYKAHAMRYASLLTNSTFIETPDRALDEAFKWAVVSIEQLRARTVAPYTRGPGSADAALPDDELGLVAGYYASGDSARPGFGWFFGRDSLYSLYAVNGYGDFALSKAELEFLIRRQRDDGKIMHEYSQTAAAIDWRAFPYMYAAADSTPLFLLAVADYARSSGDVAFLTAHRNAIEKAWTFETTHDSDGDGIYDNSQGTGWVESWPSGMPHQEIYLALLDQQASAAMARIEDLLKDHEKSAAAQQRAETIAKTIEAEYYDPEKGCYAFSRGVDGVLDRTATVYPAMAWWDTYLPGGKSILAHSEGCLRQLAGHTLNTDWGLRDVASDEKFYDGMSYHQGSVWPLFTGWAALAEYRGGQPLVGYQMLMENANLTRAQDLGAVTELLSGDFYVPFGRSTSHQMWSSAMVITPTLRGLFGIDIDAQKKIITVNPHLPASWNVAKIRHVAVGSDTVDLLFTRLGSAITVKIQGENAGRIRLATPVASAKQLAGEGLEIPGPGVEVEPEISALLPGARTESLHVLSQTNTDNSLTLTLEGPAESEFRIPLFVSWHLRKLVVSGAELQSPSEPEKPGATVSQELLTGHFPPGEGWKTSTVTLTW